MPDRDLSEIALIVFFLTLATVFIALTFTFRASSAKLFPRLTGAIIVVGTILLLVSDRLPTSMQRVVDEPVDLVDRDEFEEYEAGPEDGSGDSSTERAGREKDEPRDREATDGPTAPDADRPGPIARLEERVTPRQFTFAAVAGYVGIGYLVSLLVATPFFVIVYGYWNRHPWWVTGTLAVISVVICVLFIELANAPLDQSLLSPRGYL